MKFIAKKAEKIKEKMQGDSRLQGQRACCAK